MRAGSTCPRPDGAEAELTGAPTAPPGYAGEYLPAHLSRRTTP